MLAPISKWFRFEFRQSRHDRLRQGFRPMVEALEGRLAPAAWNPIGPTNIGGRIVGLAADPTDANTIYIAAAGGGVWKTNNATNANPTWTPLTDTQSTLFMGSIAIAPGGGPNQRIIYAGTGEANNSLDSFYGRGALISKDSGNTWTLSGNRVFNRLAISKVIIDPTDPTGNTAYAAVKGSATNGTFGNPGIWKTTDGINWTNTTAGIVDPTVGNAFSDLVMDPGNAKMLYAAVGTSRGLPANGVYQTSDGGATWAQLKAFPGGMSAGRITLAVTDVGASSTLYASISDPANNNAVLAIEKSADGGTTWNAVMTSTSANYINYVGTQGWYDQTLTIDPKDPTGNTAYAAGSLQVIKTSDGGMTWTDISGNSADGVGPHPDHHGIGFDVMGRLLDGSDGGIERLDNATVGTIQWTDLTGNLAITQFTGIALHPTNPNFAIGGSQDNGTEIYTGTGTWNVVVGGDGGFVRIDPNNPMHVYTENFGITFQRSDDSGMTFNGKANGIQGNEPDDYDPQAPSFYLPYVIDPMNTNRLVLGTNFVNESTNNGDTWQAIGTPGMNGYNANASGVTAIATQGNVVYAATADGNVWVTTNDGTSWTQTNPITGVPFLAGRVFQDIEIDPTDATGNTAYIVTASFSEDIGGTATSPGHVFKTTNAGTTWTDISGNLPNLPTWSLAIDTPDNTLFAGTDNGVYASTNGGLTWAVYGTGMPNVEVVGLQYNAGLKLLGAGTHGRGMFEISTVPGPVPPPGAWKLELPIFVLGEPTFGKTAAATSTISPVVHVENPQAVHRRIAGDQTVLRHRVDILFAARVNGLSDPLADTMNVGAVG
ncbi:MAG TPA: hypothetical protein VKU02_21145 [Gemmataceae bacterium]|nr:hypothetical protein [Gemmataceae bacterium]